MGRKRGSYKRKESTELSSQEIADDIARYLRLAMKECHNCGAAFLAFVNAKARVRKLVVEKMRVSKRAGAPRRLFADEHWLDAVDGWKSSLAEITGAIERTGTISDSEAIKYGLENNFARHGRKPNTPFKLDSDAGRAETRRIKDALARARRQLKLK